MEPRTEGRSARGWPMETYMDGIEGRERKNGWEVAEGKLLAICETEGGGSRQSRGCEA